ncbi:hypothetical protein EC9_27150 [Rosistilla ulvae]|uniref:Uncharacterized protein n=1 Tax=Rosistilla ulvae TaxID=1930277 RepID=A0A517M0W4_9BACT|nr:hypothetical protein [Rosistilla ulvae]QDS88524.1 hypothetical protein EC9_27150 [Rosistilla ulvae]
MKVAQWIVVLVCLTTPLLGCGNPNSVSPDDPKFNEPMPPVDGAAEQAASQK